MMNHVARKVARLGLLAGVLALAPLAAADITGHAGLHMNPGWGGWGGFGSSWGGGSSFGPGGININGSYRGSHWTVDYSFGGWSGWDRANCAIGGQPGWGIRGDGWSINGGWGGWGGGWSGPGYYSWRWYYDRYRPYGYATGPVEARTAPVDWSLLPGVNPPSADASAADLPKAEPTKLDLAHEASVGRQNEQAVELYREHLKASPDDDAVKRELAVAMLEGKETGAGLAMLRDLYTKDPTLADRAFDGSVMGVDASRLRELIVKVSPIANKVKSPSAWLAVVVFMQAEGRKAEALRAAQKAKDAGLERAVVDRFVAALTPPPPAPKPAPAAKPAPAPKPAPGAKPAAPAKSGPPKPGPVEPAPGEKPEAVPGETPQK